LQMVPTKTKGARTIHNPLLACAAASPESVADGVIELTIAIPVPNEARAVYVSRAERLIAMN
jgi:hypothetical protein